MCPAILRKHAVGSTNVSIVASVILSSQIDIQRKLLADGADAERTVKHLVDSTDFWNLRTTRLAVVLAYLQEMTAQLPHWAVYKDAPAQLAIGVEHHRG